MSRQITFYIKPDFTKFIILQGFENWKGNSPDDYSDEAIEDFLNAFPHKEMGYDVDFIRRTLKEIQYRYTAENLLNSSIENDNLKQTVIFSLIADTGLRIEEICNLKVSDIITTDSIMIIFEIGGRRRYAPISFKTMNFINTYIDINNLNDDDYLFKKNDGSKLTRQSIYRSVRDVLIKNEVKTDISRLRNSFRTLDLHDMQQLTDNKEEFQIIESINRAINLIIEDNCSSELSNAIEELIEVYNELELDCD